MPIFGGLAPALRRGLTLRSGGAPDEIRHNPAREKIEGAARLRGGQIAPCKRQHQVVASRFLAELRHLVADRGDRPAEARAYPMK